MKTLGRIAIVIVLGLIAFSVVDGFNRPATNNGFLPYGILLWGLVAVALIACFIHEKKKGR